MTNEKKGHWCPKESNNTLSQKVSCFHGILIMGKDKLESFVVIVQKVLLQSCTNVCYVFD